MPSLCINNIITDTHYLFSCNKMSIPIVEIQIKKNYYFIISFVLRKYEKEHRYALSSLKYRSIYLYIIRVYKLCEYISNKVQLNVFIQ